MNGHEAEEATPIHVRALGRIITCGDLVAPATACQWRGRPAAIGFVGNGVALASSARTFAAIRFVPYPNAAVRGDGASRTVSFTGWEEEVVFADPAAALAFTRDLTVNRDKSYAENKATRRLRMNSGEILVGRCTYLGGAHLPLKVKAMYDIAARAEAIEVFVHPATGISEPVFRFTYAPGLSVGLSGPGEVTRGGGWIGGGFGPVGALEGAAIASVLSSLTTKRTIHTIITIAERGSEGFFLNVDSTPDQMRLRLSPLFVRLRALDDSISAHPEATPAFDQHDLISRLERLAALHASGALTETEFATAKAALIRGA